MSSEIRTIFRLQITLNQLSLQMHSLSDKSIITARFAIINLNLFSSRARPGFLPPLPGAAALSPLKSLPTSSLRQTTAGGRESASSCLSRIHFKQFFNQKQQNICKLFFYSGFSILGNNKQQVGSFCMKAFISYLITVLAHQKF